MSDINTFKEVQGFRIENVFISEFVYSSLVEMRDFTARREYSRKISPLQTKV